MGFKNAVGLEAMSGVFQVYELIYYLYIFNISTVFVSI